MATINKGAAMTDNTCTVVTTATGGRCGAEAVHSFTATDGVTRFHECIAHNTDFIDKAIVQGSGNVGDHVQVHRYGKTYDAVITRVGKRGAAYATFTYDNGAERTVRI